MLSFLNIASTASLKVNPLFTFVALAVDWE